MGHVRDNGISIGSLVKQLETIFIHSSKQRVLSLQRC